jgi:hypothetical protein
MCSVPKIPDITLFFEYSVHRVHFTPSNELSPPTTFPIESPSHPHIQDPPKWGLLSAPAKTHPDPATELSKNDLLEFLLEGVRSLSSRNIQFNQYKICTMAVKPGWYKLVRILPL